ncbi:MAG: DUF3987 domain-containing protein [Dehalococcoidia bacterium]|nr:DUF3987 domain-containing protein [Dehalococcoidia bacterium]
MDPGRQEGTNRRAARRSRLERRSPGENPMTTVNDVIANAQPYEGAPPEPLRRQVDPPETYPIDALGDLLTPAARLLHAVIRSPEAICAQSVLAAATLTTQGHADVLIDGRRLPLSEFFISVGESGVRKSATDRAALAPVKNHQRKLLEEYTELRLEADIAGAMWKREREEALRKPKKDERKAALEALGEPPASPLYPMLTTEEPTYEGLVKLLEGGWPSVGLFSDEGGRFLGGYAMGEEQRIKTMAGLNSLWDGSPITRTRGGDGSIMLFGRRVALNLLVQPLISEMLFGDRFAHDQGLMSRCLVSSPASTLGQQLYVEVDYTADPVFKRYFARLSDILETDLPWELDLRGQKTGGVKPRELEIAPDAKRLWVVFHDWVQEHLREDGILRPVSGIAAKAAEHALRLAGVLALIDDIEADLVSRRHIDAGIVLAQYYLGEALRLFDSARTNPDLVLAEKLLVWLRARYANSRNSGNSSRWTPVLVYPVLIYQHGPNALRDKATAKNIIGILEGHGWLLRVEGGAVVDEKHRQDVWSVHPTLWEAG